MPGDQKNQAPNPLSAEITSVETDFNTACPKHTQALQFQRQFYG